MPNKTDTTIEKPKSVKLTAFRFAPGKESTAAIKKVLAAFPDLLVEFSYYKAGKKTKSE